MKFYPYEKGGAEKVLVMLKGGHKKFWGRFYPVAWCFSHIVGGARKVLPCLEGGGGAKSFGPAIFPFCSPPLPVINDQSLTTNFSQNVTEPSKGISVTQFVAFADVSQN